jgi:hypothetical protein
LPKIDQPPASGIFLFMQYSEYIEIRLYIIVVKQW